ncbi:hypothetical protein ARAM_000227 [Aspergillus rambellii]|uniref:Zn(2)-C6 fungal-type domain-containing protein n=1 Tax=Aspergillus rambellii TaxID=308745 RepID=A0A0F8W7X1_9EURO|nr:hypothetical protein ARAM_000227 [Aspergillus rambellii]
MVSSADVPAQFVLNWKPYSRTSSRGTSNQSSPKGGSSPGTNHKLCLACDACRQARVKCSGGNPCRRCMNNDGYCHYSVSMRSGRTKAIHNKKRQSNSRNSRNSSNSSSEAPPPPPPPPATVDNGLKNAVPIDADYEKITHKVTPDKITTSLDDSMALDDFTLLNATDSSSSSNMGLTPDPALRDFFSGDFDNLDLSSIFSSVNSSGLGRDGIPMDPPFPRPPSSRLSFNGHGLGEASPNSRCNQLTASLWDDPMFLL